MIKLSIVYPTFNEAKNPFFIKNLKLFKQLLSIHHDIEIIFVDKHSSDETLHLITSEFKVIQSNNNDRASRLNEGYQHSKGKMILFHHPRSSLSLEGIIKLKNTENIFWGGFSHRFDQDHGLLRFTSWYSNNVRAKLREIFYLDHCIFIQRSIIEKEGSEPFPSISIFEDTAFSEKYNKRFPSTLLLYPSTTSSVRFQKNGIFFQAFMNQVLKICYALKVSPEKMNKIYEKGLELNSSYSK